MLNNSLFFSLCLIIGLFASDAGANGAGTACDRDAFGSYRQIDLVDTRGRLLIQYSDGDFDIVSSSSGKKRVVFGSWTDPYTGRAFNNVPARTMDVDHVIPVCWAWDHGAYDWTDEKRREFYNDERFMRVVEAGLNRQKGKQGPETFVPMQRGFACEYVHIFLDGVRFYRLQLSDTENRRIAQARDLACGTGVH